MPGGCRTEPGWTGSTRFVLADAVRIREVLVNILSNAVKFTEDGGAITFETQCRPGGDEQHVNKALPVSRNHQMLSQSAALISCRRRMPSEMKLPDQAVQP